jgi:hypothetical protein
MNRVFIPMSADNIQKILLGKKTTTIRSKRANEQIGMFIGETSVTNFGGTDFLVTNKGLLSIEEAGGKEKMLRTECFGDMGPIYKQTKDWLDGKGKLYVYEIKELDEPTI